METHNKEILFGLIQYAVWNIEMKEAVDWPLFKEMKMHAIAALTAPVLPELSLSPELSEAWEKDIIRQLSRYYNYMKAQATLPLFVPYTVLKGSSAAQYYPYPEYRELGDIDLMTRREDYETACGMLIDNGYKEVKINDDIRHRKFEKKGILVEIHAYFASLNDPEQAKYLDDLIIKNINPSHVLPDLVNGLVLLEHISQHLEHGLGLRQIIDWMMFVDKCLPDRKWPVFQEMVQKIGLETLAQTVTRMCEMYLGLPRRIWCMKADQALCEQLMDYILSCGNFGNKWEPDFRAGTKILSYVNRPLALLSMLQKNGIEKWEAARKNPVLRPFAWIYQVGEYIAKGSSRNQSVSNLRLEFSFIKKRNAMFDSLGIKQTPKGLVVYQDGEYKKS